MLHGALNHTSVHLDHITWQIEQIKLKLIQGIIQKVMYQPTMSLNKGKS